MDEKEYLLVSSVADRSKRRAPGPCSFWRRNCCPCVPARYVLALIAFLGFCNVYALRVNLSMAIVLMVNTSQVADDGHQAHKVREGEAGSSQNRGDSPPSRAARLAAQTFMVPVWPAKRNRTHAVLAPSWRLLYPVRKTVACPLQH